MEIPSYDQNVQNPNNLSICAEFSADDIHK